MAQKATELSSTDSIEGGKIRSDRGGVGEGGRVHAIAIGRC